MGLSDPNHLLDRFWRELAELRTGMLGLSTESDAHAQPMTAHFEGGHGPIWFYARKDSGLVHHAETPHPAVFHYVGRGHDLYACVHGEVVSAMDRDVIARFWSEDVARWFPRGQSDPNLVLLRFSPSSAQIWLPSHEPTAQLFGFGAPRAATDVHTEVRL